MNTVTVLSPETYRQCCRELAASWSLEELLSEPLGFGLVLSPVQRACARIAEGKPLGELAGDPAVVRALGGWDAVEAYARCGRPAEFAIISAIRSGKSLIGGAGLAIHASLTADLSLLGPGEIARCAIVSVHKDQAGAVYEHCLGRIAESPVLRELLEGEPTKTAIRLRRADGRVVEIKVIAGSRGGASLVSRWNTAVIFDEVARFADVDAKINWNDARVSVQKRIVPGGYLAHVSSPWGPLGPAYKLVTEHHGRPSKKVVVVHSPGWDFLPSYWTPERVEEARGTDAFATDVAAEFRELSESLYTRESIDRVLREDDTPIPREEGYSYAAAIDPASRKNSFALVIGTRRGAKRTVVRAREWLPGPGAPLDLSAVLVELARELAAYGLQHAQSDHWAVDALNAAARHVRLGLEEKEAPYGLWFHAVQRTAAERVEAAKAVANLLEGAEPNLSLPRVENLRADLSRVRRRVTRTGLDIELPVTSDGRHCDLYEALSRLAVMPIADYVEPIPGPERARQERRALARRRYGGEERPRWVDE